LIEVFAPSPTSVAAADTQNRLVVLARVKRPFRTGPIPGVSLPNSAIPAKPTTIARARIGIRKKKSLAAIDIAGHLLPLSFTVFLKNP
jgi:hypothetical protein